MKTQPIHRGLTRAAALLTLAASLLPAAAAADSGTCPSGSTTVNDADPACHIVTPPIVGSGVIAVDGQEGGQWGSAQQKSMTGDFTGTVHLYRSTDDLYLLIQVPDASFSTSDQVQLFIDPLHDHAGTSEDLQFQIRRDGGGGHVKITGGAVAPWNPATEGSELGIDGDTAGAPTWTVELRLTPAELGLSNLPPVVGFGVQAEDSGTGNLTVWPAGFDGTAPATTWANLKTRYPIDYMVVLDQSGSMLSQDKWEDATNAANFLANTMAIFRQATHFQDRIGVVTFEWDCFGSNQTATDITLAQVTSSPGDYTADLSDPASDNCTPIGEGLAEAFGPGNLDANQDTNAVERQRGMLLLSDGLQNRPSSTFVPSDTGYASCNGGAFQICDSSNVQVDTVAFGEGDWQVDTDVLSEVKSHYAGITEGTYNLSTTGPELIEPFLLALENFFRLNLAGTPGAPAPFPVTSGNHRLAVLHSWSTPAQANDIKLQLNGVDQPGATCPPADDTVGLAYCVIDHPAAGSWAAVPAGGGVAAGTEFRLVDLKVRARFAMDRVVHGTGLDLVLTAELKDGGRPLTNDPATHPVDVRVRIERPQEGVGTFATIHEPETCERIEPQLPLPPRVGVQVHSHAGSFPGSGTSAASSGSSDPAPSRFTHLASLLDACGRQGLERVEDPGIELRDDGTQGDELADDGIYTLRFDATRFEGTYVFSFEVEGTTLDGEPFTRARRFAEYVRVEVDPESTPTGSRVLGTSGNLVLREYHVLPRDRFGGYLGLGRARQVDFVASDGVWVGPVIDYGNGFYSRILRYDRTRGEPEVTPVVQGKPMTRPGRGMEVVFPFVGITLFDDDLDLDDGPVVGARLGFRLQPRLVLEIEGALTDTETQDGRSARLHQFLLNLRYDLPVGAIGGWHPYVTGGAGLALYTAEFVAHDEAFAGQVGLGATRAWGNDRGLRLDARLLGLDDLAGSGWTTNAQLSAGLVFFLE